MAGSSNLTPDLLPCLQPEYCVSSPHVWRRPPQVSAAGAADWLRAPYSLAR